MTRETRGDQIKMRNTKTNMGWRAASIALAAALAVEGFGPAAMRVFAEEAVAEAVCEQQDGEGLQVAEPGEGAEPDAAAIAEGTEASGPDAQEADGASEADAGNGACGQPADGAVTAESADGSTGLPKAPSEVVSLATSAGDVPYVDVDGNEGTLRPKEVLSGTVDEERTLESGAYFVKGDTTFNQRVYIHGDVTIVIADGVTLNCKVGLECNVGNSLTVLGQKRKSGKLKAESADYHAGIGSGWGPRVGDITLCGIDVYAWGHHCAAAIGGGNLGCGGTITIKRAWVRATAYGYGAAIGGGHARGGCDLVTIEDSDVKATSSYRSAAIGGSDGENNGDGGDGGKVVIRNSKVTVSTEDKGAGIGGGGASMLYDAGAGGEVWIEGDSVVDAKSGKGAAIGRGYHDNDGVGTVHFDDHLKVTDLSENVGKIASSGEREGYCRYRNHVRIESCDHQGSQWRADGQDGHVLECPHCAVRSTKPHEWDGDGHCATCGCEKCKHDYDESWVCRKCQHVCKQPAYREATLATRDQMGVTFWFEVPTDEGIDYEGATVELSVGGKAARTQTLSLDDCVRDRQGRRGYTMPLSAIEMAEEVTATLRYGRDCTVQGKDSIRAIVAESQQGDRCARTMANLSHCLQGYLSKEQRWRVGKDYADMDLFFPELNDVARAKGELEYFATLDEFVARGNNRISCSLAFGPTVTLSICIKNNDGLTNGPAYALVGNERVDAERLPDGRQVIRIGGIKPSEFNKIMGFCCHLADGEGNERPCAGRISVLSVAQAALASGKLGEEGEAAYASVYWFWKAVSEL